jgi:uncharacterized protein
VVANAPVTDPATPSPGIISRFFVFIVARRWLVVALYALLLPPAALYAAKVGQDNSIDRLIVPTDPDYVATREFEKVFGSGEYAVLLAEADDPYAPAVLERLDKIERALRELPQVHANSALSIYRRAKAGFSGTPEEVAGFRKFASGSAILKRQGLAGEGFLAVALVLDVHDRKDRRDTLAAVDRAVDAAGGGSPPLRALRRVGQPYVNVDLDRATERYGAICFSLFAVFVVVLNVALYRSLRTLLAFLITLGVCLALSVGYIGLTGGTFTIVSPMVPMTILVTATATLVYLQSRFVDRPADRPVDEHQIFALTNKFVACTASIFATLVGFAALYVSDIRPVREMGVWVAVGLLLTWIVVLTLFPALQKILKTPTSIGEKEDHAWFIALTAWIPAFSYRFRYALVVGAIALCGGGLVALFGLPGVVKPMELLIDPVEYISRDTSLYEDTKHIEKILPGLSVTEVWLKGSLGAISEPEVLTGLHRFQGRLEADPDVGAAIGATTILQITRYLGGEGDGWPTDKEAVDQLAADFEGLIPVEPMIQRFTNRSLSQTHLAVISRATEHEGFRKLDASIHRHWDEAVAESPALKTLEMKTVGLGPLQAKMSQNLVPTLVESFGLTVGIIFMTFVVVFRSGAARIMTMIPSLFAILVMFTVMRVSGMLLNVATILIASTVLGTSENDQIHFFYHFLEKRKTGTVEEALRHTLRISGKAIFFATLINAGGFLAFATAGLPPMRQFGILTAVALVMSMIADFTALPAALWIVFREKPDAAKR